MEGVSHPHKSFAFASFLLSPALYQVQAKTMALSREEREPLGNAAEHPGWNTDVGWRSLIEEAGFVDLLDLCLKVWDEGGFAPSLLSARCYQLAFSIQGMLL